MTQQQWTTFFRDKWIVREKNQLTHLGQKTDGWDFSIYSHLLSQPDLYVLQPVFARTNHTGAEGTYCTAEYQDASFSYVEVCDVEVDTYNVINTQTLSGVARAYFILMNEMNSAMATLKAIESERRSLVTASMIQRIAKGVAEKVDEFKSSERVRPVVSTLKKLIVNSPHR